MKNSILLFFATLVVNSAIAQDRTGSPDGDPILMRTIAGSSQPSEDSIFGSPDADPIAMKIIAGSSQPLEDSIFGTPDTDPIVMKTIAGSSQPSEDSIFGSPDADPIVMKTIAGSSQPSEDSIFGTPDTDPIAMKIIVGSSQSSEEIKLNVYPNLTSGKITVKFESDSKIAEEMMVIDMQGRIILRDQLDSSSSFTKEMDLESLDNGIYLLNIMNKEGVISTSRVVKTQ